MTAATGADRWYRKPEQPPVRDGWLRWWWLGLLLSLGLVALMPRAIGLGGGDYSIHRAFDELEDLRAALKSYHETHGAYPTSEQGLGLLRSDGFVKRLPADPWRHPYVYRYNNAADTFLLYSLGADGVDDQGAGDDITDREKAYSCREYGVNCPPLVVPAAALLLATACLMIGIGRGLAGRHQA